MEQFSSEKCAFFAEKICWEMGKAVDLGGGFWFKRETCELFGYHLVTWFFL